MARDSSPLSKRLKALAVRAGLPIESGQTGGVPSPAPIASASAAPDDEQPTGEFPAVAASDTPEEDRPTGEFPAVDQTDPDATLEPLPDPAAETAPTPADASPAAPDGPSTAFAGAVPPPPRDDDPAPTRDEEPPRPTVPPIWTDSPAESQSPLTAAQADGPTLAPPTLTSLPGPDAPDTTKPEPSVDGVASSEDATADEGPEPATQLHEVVPDERTRDDQADAPASRAAELDEALSLEPSPVDEAEDHAPDESAEPSVDEQETIAADALSAASKPDGTATDASADAAADTNTTAVDESPTPDLESTSDTDAPEPPASEPTDKLSLTGRIAAIRRRIRPDTPPAGADVTSPNSPAQPATAADEPPPPVTVVEPTPPADAPVDEHFAKPSFSERAALRRRVKTLRARRDAGLLEIGAITIDQRRFGDPTAGTLLRRRTDELVDLDNEIAAIEYALEEHASATAIAALGTVRCLGCGTLVGPADRYCAHCGTPRPTDTGSSEVQADRGS